MWVRVERGLPVRKRLQAFLLVGTSLRIEIRGHVELYLSTIDQLKSMWPAVNVYNLMPYKMLLLHRVVSYRAK